MKNNNIHRKYKALGNLSIFEAGVSDHKPLLKGFVLSWNTMMQGKRRMRDNIPSYNNGYGLDETNFVYRQRLQKIAAVLNEIVTEHRGQIKVIALQEAPIQPADLFIFKATFYQFPNLRPFLKSLSESDCVTPWGLMTLVSNKENVYYQRLPSVWTGELYDFNTRAQLTRIYNATTGKPAIVVNIHIPHALHNQTAQVQKLLTQITYEAPLTNIVIAGDFNVNPTEFNFCSARTYSVPKNNVQLIVSNDGNFNHNYYENVDAIISQHPAFI